MNLIVLIYMSANILQNMTQKMRDGHKQFIFFLKILNLLFFSAGPNGFLPKVTPDNLPGVTVT